MTTVWVGARNTLNKIWQRGKYKVFFLICCAASLLLALYSRGGHSVVISGLAFNLSRGSYSMLELLNTIFLPLLSFMLCADYYAHELSDGTIRGELLRPTGRGSLYFGKALGMLLYCGEILLANMLIGTAVNVFTGALGSLPLFWLSTIMSLLVTACFIAISAFAANVLKHPSLLMFVMIIGYVLLLFVGSAFSGIGAFLFTSYVNWYKMILGSIIPWRNLVVTLLLLLSATTLFSSLGQVVFERRDIS